MYNFTHDVTLQLHFFMQLVSVLYSSKQGKTKDFVCNGVKFGWSTIEELFEREMQRVQSGSLKRVPGLKESYVHRDIWTRLNVKPAKIMQVH